MVQYKADAALYEALQASLKKTLASKGKVSDPLKWRDAREALEECAAPLQEIEAAKPEVPILRRYCTNDATAEKLGELLAQNPAGLLLFRDELVSWLRGLDRDGREEARGFFLQGWNGTGGYTFDRIIRGTVRIDAVTISALGGIQPGPLARYVAEASSAGVGNDGLLQRFQLLVWPDDAKEWRNVDRWPETEAKNRAFKVFECLAAIDAVALGADTTDGKIPSLRFCESAQELFDEWRNELENKKLRSGEAEAIEAHLSKYRSLAPSLALLFHLIDGGVGPVTLRAAAKAFDWCDFLETHARRVYGAGMIQGLDAAHALAAKIQDGKLPAKFSPRDVYLKGWSHLDKDAVYHGLDVLAGCEWVRIEPIRTGGRPTKIVTVNPKLGVPRA